MLLTILLTSKTDIVHNQTLVNLKNRKFKLFLIKKASQKKLKKNTNTLQSAYSEKR